MASVWGELKRRNVVKVAMVYAVVTWLLMQIVDTAAPALHLPDWTLSLTTLLLIIGFPLALIFAWAFELTPEGIKSSRSIEPDDSIAHNTGRKLDFIIIGVLVLAVGFMFLDNYVLNSADSVVGTEIDIASSGPAPDQTQGVEEASLPDRRSIAALPFSNESAEEENAEFFANGIHDELLTQLAKIASLKVISRTSVLEYRDSPKNMREIGSELGVATLLEGRVQRAGDMVRINIQLFDAQTDENLWAETYNRELTAENIFEIQAEMATAIASALQAAMTPQEVAQLGEIPTDSTRAYDFYLSGNDYYSHPDDRTFKPLAVQQYERAVAEDPSFALAWAALSRAHSLMYWYGVDRTEARLKMSLDAVEHAFEFAPNLPEAHVALGQYHYLGFRDYPKALAELDIAEQGIPGASTLLELRAFIQRRMGAPEQFVITMGQAIERDPRNTDLLFQQATTYGLLRNYEQADQYYERALEIEPDNGLVYFFRAWSLIMGGGDITLAKAAAAKPPVDLGNRRYYLGWLAALYERDYSTALAYLDDLEAEAIEFNDRYYSKASFYGVTYSLAGQAEAGMEHFDAARTQVEAALKTSPEDARLYVALGELMAGLGETEQALDLARRATELMPKSRDSDSGAWIQSDLVRRVYIPVGAYAVGLQELDNYLSEPGLWSIEGLLPDPRLDPIREDPRFLALVEKYKRQ